MLLKYILYTSAYASKNSRRCSQIQGLLLRSALFSLETGRCRAEGHRVAVSDDLQRPPNPGTCGQRLSDGSLDGNHTTTLVSLGLSKFLRCASLNSFGDVAAMPTWAFVLMDLCTQGNMCTCCGRHSVPARPLSASCIPRSPVLSKI